MSKFKDAVIKAVRSVPRGKVASYGQIATIVGSPRSAIQVGWILHLCGEDGITPWWRVINKKGHISTKCPEHTPNTQKILLEKDGVVVSEYLNVDLKMYGYITNKKLLKNLELKNDYIFEIMEKYKV